MPNYTNKLQGCRVLIIGGSAGIGYGVADAVLEHGGIVIISSSSPDRIAGAIKSLRAAHPNHAGRVSGLRCDLSSSDTLESEVSKLFAETSTLGKLNHVVFTAGDALPTRKLEDFSLQEMQQLGLVRFFAPLVVAQQLRKHMSPGPAASYTLSTGGIPEHLFKDWAVIHSYLSGINGMTRGLAVDLAPIRVNAIGLGPVETELWDGAKQAGVYAPLMARFEAKMATGSIGKVEDVVEAYLYVMKDRNVSGSIVNSHGGMLLL